MPPKKAAGSAPTNSTAEATTKPAVNGVIKSKPKPKPTTTEASAKAPAKVKAPAKRAAKATVAKAPAKTTTKPAPKDTNIKVAANTSKKRKAADDEESEEPQVNGTKRQRTAAKSASPAPATSKGKPAARPKAPAIKKPKKKVVVNQASTDRLDVYVFGEGSSGELGLGSAKGQTEVKRPRLNPLLAASTVGVVATSVGGMHTAALTHDNKILTWGVNDQAALGRDTTWDGGLRDIDDDNSDSDSDSGSDTGVNPKESTPAEVDMSQLPDDIVWTQIECTDSATFALTNEGLVYGWGTFRVSHYTPPVCQLC